MDNIFTLELQIAVYGAIFLSTLIVIGKYDYGQNSNKGK